MDSSRPITLDRVVRTLAALLILAGLFWLVNTLSNVLLPFCLACVIAYILEPLVEHNMRVLRLRSRAVASLITLGETITMLGVLCYLFAPSIIAEVHQLEHIIAHASASSGSPIPFLPPEWADQVRQAIKSFDLSSLLHDSHFESIVNSGTSILSAVVGFLLHALEWALTFIYVIFILIDYPSIMSGFRRMVPVKYRPVVYRVEDDIKQSMNLYFRGQILIAACAALFYAVGFSIVGIPLAIIMGLLVGVLYIIPYFQYVTLIPVTIICFIYSMGGAIGFWTVFGECIMVYVVAQSVCDYILTPKIMGRNLGLNPAIILLSLSVWGSLLGILGMVIALPLTTVLLAYYKEYIIDPAKKP